ncbi:MAG: hypothetical protein ACLRRN_04265 [Oscillospiraceae bacterium]
MCCRRSTCCCRASATAASRSSAGPTARATSASCAARARAYRAAFGITAVCIVALFLTRSVIGVLFGASAEANAGVTARLPLFLATLPLLAYTRVTIAYFYATEKTALSYVLVFSEPVLTFVVLLILPQLLKLTGVWLAIPAAQALTFCIAVPARRRTQRARELPA